MLGTSISGAWVVRELDALVRVYGTPACIVSPAWDIAAKYPRGSGWRRRVHKPRYLEVGWGLQLRLALHCSGKPQPVLGRSCSCRVPVSLVAAGTNCTESTYVSADRVTVTIEYFLLGAAKGFVQIRVAADMSQVVQALVASGGMASQFGRSGPNLDATVAVQHRFWRLGNPSDSSGTVSDGTI